MLRRYARTLTFTFTVLLSFYTIDFADNDLFQGIAIEEIRFDTFEIIHALI